MEVKHVLSDQAIVRIVDLLQLALLTGTDIVDNLRTLILTSVDGKLVIAKSDEDAFKAGIDRLQTQALTAVAERNDPINVD